MSPRTSAAFRLHAFLTEAQKANAAGNLRMDAVLSKVLGIPPGETIALYRAFAELADLARDAAGEIRLAHSPGDGKIVSPDAADDMARIPTVVEQRLRKGELKMDAKQLTSLEIGELRLASHTILPFTHERTPAKDDIAEAKSLVDRAKDVVLNSDLPEQVKAELTERLNAVLRAIENYRIFGLRGIATSAAAVQASVVAALPAVGPSRWEKCREVVGFMSDLTSLMMNAGILAQFAIASASQHLPHLLQAGK